jgi:hypothetical protein
MRAFAPGGEGGRLCPWLAWFRTCRKSMPLIGLSFPTSVPIDPGRIVYNRKASVY